MTYLMTFANEFEGKVIVDTSNLIHVLPETQHGTTCAAECDACPNGTPRDCQVTGATRELRLAVVDLVNSVGYRAMDCGPNENGRLLEMMRKLC